MPKFFLKRFGMFYQVSLFLKFYRFTSNVLILLLKNLAVKSYRLLEVWEVMRMQINNQPHPVQRINHVLLLWYPSLTLMILMIHHWKVYALSQCYGYAFIKSKRLVIKVSFDIRNFSSEQQLYLSELCLYIFF